MLHLKNDTNYRSGQTSGFALVIALSLMAMVLLLILSMTTLVQVETSSSQIQIQRLQAEQNARLGLGIALGVLQGNMGPDQRISATADILSSTDASRKNTVGIWVSDPNGTTNSNGTYYAEGNLIRWLSSDATAVDFNTTSAPATGVKLVATGSLPDIDKDGEPDDLNDDIIVDTQNTTIKASNGDVSGHYAWWIGDEGVKARINLNSTSSQTNTNKIKQQGVRAAESFPNSTITGFTDFKNVALDNDAERLIENSALGLIAGGSVDIEKPYFHSLTTWSSGVLADAKNGGLKTDLSLAFEMSDAQFNTSKFAATGPSTIDAPGFGKVQPIFNLANSTDFDAHGPVWQLLRDYYRLYHKMDTPMNNPTIDARIFGPNLNGGSALAPVTSLSPLTSLKTSSATIDKQSAVLFAGGKTKSYNYNYYKGVLDGKEPGESPDQHPNRNNAIFDYRMLLSDPMRRGVDGDPLRGGGQLSVIGYTMPVMVTANYMPYMLRFIGEMGLWFPTISTDYSPDMPPGEAVGLEIASRERVVMHNPYNVNVRHDEIAIDSFGLDIEIVLEQNGSDYFTYYDENGKLKRTTQARSPFMEEAKRRTRMAPGMFAPGQIKTFTADDFGAGYSREDTVPDWHHFKWSDNANVHPTRIQKPAETGEDPYLLNVYGSFLHDALVNPGYNFNYEYSITQALFVTHLKQSGNSINDDFIRDQWPMASIIDTAILLPGYKMNSSTRRPSGESRFFQKNDQPSDPLKLNDRIYLTRSLIEASNQQQQTLPIVTFNLQVKPAKYDRKSVRYPAFARSNPLAPVRDNKNLLPADDFLDMTVGFSKISPDMELEMERSSTQGMGASLNFWGPTDGTVGDISNPVLIDLPTSPVLSLGKLQNANLSIHEHMPALAVGNSLASVYIDPEQTYSINDNYYEQSRIFYDLSYLLNEALWDQYFFTSYSIPYNESADDYDEVNDTVSETFDAAFVDKTEPLPDPRMKLNLQAAESVTSVRSKLFAGTTIATTAPYRAAENLMVDGNFNVNSTSIDAWRAVLSGARDQAIFQSGSLTGTQPAAGSTPFSRLTQPLEGEWDGSSSSSKEAWSGFRSLDDDAIEGLATAIVSEIKNRVSTNNHPYLSLADFVNRELSSGPTGRSGLIQAAIDQTELNGPFEIAPSEISKDDMDNVDFGRFPYPKNILQANGENGTANMSATTYLMQADVLQAIGSFITVRSDTFRIRSYGESLNPITGKVTSKVWYEAIVQRTPEPVNPLSGTTPDQADYWKDRPANGNAAPFGRRFKIVSIRQLTEDEV
jgi:hypothetical protein